MIPREKQVTSLELSKRLKKLGVTQDSLFAWYQYRDKVYCEYREYQASCDAQSTYQDGYAKLPVEICAAFTVAELGEMLPLLRIYSFKYSDNDFRIWNDDITFSEETEIDTRARMLIYLIENKFMGANK